uniref:Sodefrin-like factor n=1 Tax=Notophthalmus viridescens TaxID=8316 RepID=A0A0E3N2L9_NOTVI|nr:sodefrin precursor-like factor [Notophthalmus viridescens]
MKALLASISILFAFISRGNAIECGVCSDRSSMDCSGELVTCDQTVESCQTAITDLTIVPPENTTLNGVKCPTCVVDGELSCEATEVLECVGEMTNCLYIAATFRNTATPPKQAAYRGCTCAEFAEHVPIGPADTVQDVVTLIVSKGV